VQVAATIKPIHSLVASVMGDAGTPDLILDGTVSEHVATLRPSQARMIEQADVIFAVGEGLESFLPRLLENRDGQAVVELAEAPGMRLYAYREQAQGGVDDEAGHADEHGGAEVDEDHHEHGEIDPHVWVDPDNAKAIARHIAEVLSKADPANASVYRRNAEGLIGDLEALAAELEAKLAPVKSRPFLVFHDAYQYLEKRFGLNGLGGIVLSPDRPPGAKRLKEIRERVAEAGIACIFSEPQFEIGYVRTVMEATGARSASLDILGTAVEPGPQAYGKIMLDVAETIADCLAGR
jgi:zinc transport system substrate-binding protein